jgi:Putative lumazine-binding
MREKTAAEMLAAVGDGPADILQSQQPEQINVLDVSGSIASAKLVTPGWVDYITLLKENGRWKILSVVQKLQN